MRDILKKIGAMAPEPIKRSSKFMHVVIKDYTEDNGSLVAAAVSFYVFLSLIPILLLGIAIIGYALGSSARAESLILSTLTSNAPKLAAQRESLDFLRGVIDQVIAGRGVATGVGLLALLWVGTSLVANLEKAINIAWRVKQRKFLRKRLLALGVLAMMGGLLGVSLGITAFMNAVRSLDISVPWINEREVSWAWQLFGYMAPVALTVLTYTLFYKIMPNTSVGWKSAFAAGLFAGTLLYIAQLVFGYYATHFANYSAVYGSLAGVFILMIWIHYSVIVTMLGAEVGSICAGRRDAQ
ncbi:MAG: YihY/virulence factor BrkB family protein [Armatimonadetes bacterium]|nr:YihY/virulence factor BrkB family protein [Armatimonadota bacterium]